MLGFTSRDRSHSAIAKSPFQWRFGLGVGGRQAIERVVVGGGRPSVGWACCGGGGRPLGSLLPNILEK